MTTLDARPAVDEAAATPPPADPADGGGSDGASRIPVLAEGVELLGEMAGSGYEDAPSLVRRADGQTLQLTPLLYGVLESIGDERGYPAIAERLSERIGKTASAEDVQFLVEKKLAPLGVLRLEDGSQPVAAKANPLLALRWRLVLSDPKVTNRVTQPFARLFAPLVLLPLVVAFVATTSWVLFHKGLASATSQAFYEPGLLLTIFLMTVVSAGFHEFGHAAATRRGGATPGTMGFGIYIVWPAFYTDVSDSYRLDRRGRLRVDLGGLYFNAVFSVAAFALWLATGWDALLLLIGLQVLQMLRQLTPVIRADGYHILADLIGVPDLFAHLGPTLKSIWPGNWGKQRDGRALKRWARVLVVAWVLLIVPSLAFALLSGAVMLPRLVATAWDSLGKQWHTLGDAADRGAYAAAVLAGLKAVAVVLPVAGVLAMLGRIVLRTGRKTWAWTGTSRRRRAVAAVALLAIVVGLGWCWWPRQQYVPVRSNERGTLFDLGGSVLRAASTGSARPIAATTTTPTQNVAHRSSALLLVPRVADRPALVMLPPENGQPGKVLPIPPATPATGTSSSGGTAPATNPWPFPFSPPPEQKAGDNRAISVNTTDGTALYDVSFAVVWVTDGADVTQRNEAVALANCANCRTVAVAFQTIFIVGQNDYAVPVNTSLAVNYNCRDCQTSAIAVQLVASLTSLPDPETMAQLNALWAQLGELANQIPTLSDQEIYSRLKGIEGAILTTLERAGSSVVAAADAAAADAAATPGAQPSASPAPDGTATGASDPADGTGTGAADPSGSGATTGTTDDGATTDSSATTPSSPAPASPAPEPSSSPATDTTVTGAGDPAPATGATTGG